MDKSEVTIAVLHGCNLDMLGWRDPRHYGELTLPALQEAVAQAAGEKGWRCLFFQTNHEGALLEKLHELRESVSAIIINPGAWTHYSYALHDALELVSVPVVEVHLSDIHARAEEWRHHSVISDVCAHTITGQGLAGYLQALDWLAARLAGE